MLTPDQIEQNEQAAETLRATASLAGEFWSALRSSGVPDAAAVQMLVDWHAAAIAPDGVCWDDDQD